ncbi:GL12765 [Drosophila persimilis]|uniref:GL12765 n=1 Tax=Drosophila persimilis TaxID=7234 RepID=B4HCM5_DROPE|nr:GL12765 [Drosophila persimilis]
MEMKRELKHEETNKKNGGSAGLSRGTECDPRRKGLWCRFSSSATGVMLSRSDEEDWCNGSQFLQLQDSPLVSPTSSGCDSVSTTVSPEGSAAEDSGDEVMVTDGPSAPTAAEKAIWRQQQSAEPGTRASVKKPLTFGDRFAAVRRRFIQGTPEEKKRIRRLLEAALAMRRRLRERKEAEESSEESDEAPPPPPFHVVLPPMQSQPAEPEVEEQQEVVARAGGRGGANPGRKRAAGVDPSPAHGWHPTP